MAKAEGYGTRPFTGTPGTIKMQKLAATVVFTKEYYKKFSEEPDQDQDDVQPDDLPGDEDNLPAVASQDDMEMSTGSNDDEEDLSGSSQLDQGGDRAGSNEIDEQDDIAAQAVAIAEQPVFQQTTEQLYWNVITVVNKFGERVWVPTTIRPHRRFDFANELSSLTYSSMVVDGHRVHMPRVIVDVRTKQQEIRAAHQVCLMLMVYPDISFICFILFRGSTTTCWTPPLAPTWTRREIPPAST